MENNKVKILTKSETFFDFELKSFLKSILTGLIFGVIVFVTSILIKSLISVDGLTAYRTGILLSAVITVFLMARSGIERSLLIVLPAAIILNIVIFYTIIGKQALLFYLITAFLYAFYNWISRLSSAYLSIILTVISTILIILAI